MPNVSPSESAAVEQLLREIPQLWRGREHSDTNTCATGFAALDAALPGGGWPIGTLIELAPTCAGIGELSLPLPALRALAVAKKPIALVQPPYKPYAPGLRRAGLPLKQLLWVTESRQEDAHWAAEQLLRDGAGAVLLWTETTDDRLLRRLQLAAEAGHALAFVYRDPARLSHTSPAAVRIALQPRGSSLRIEIVKVRRGQPGAITLDLPWATA